MTRRLRRHALLAAVLAGVVVASLGGAEAKTAPSGGHAAKTGTSSSNHRQAAAAKASARDVYGIPAPQLTDPLGGGDTQIVYGGPVAPVKVDVAKAKAELTVPSSTLLGYIRSCIAQPATADAPELQTCCPNAVAGPTCPAGALVKFPATTLSEPGTANWTRSDGPVWIKSPSTSRRQYGVLPTATVHLLAYGSLPATATVHLEQPVGSDGLTTPLQFLQTQLQGPTNDLSQPIPTTIAGFPVPQPLGSDVYTFWQAITLSGPVDVRLDNLTVDGRRVDVGPSCRTASAARLSYSGPRGWSGSADTPTQLYGQPGGFNPLGSASSDDTGTAAVLVKVPKFVGCRDGNGSLDPLVTALASGSGNVAQISLTKPIVGCEFAVGDGGYPCPAYPDDPRLSGPQLSNRVTGPATLAGGVARRVARAVRLLPPGSRAGALRALPVNNRAAVMRAMR